MIKQFLIFTTPFYVILTFTGCTANLIEPEIDFQPPAYVEQMPSREEKKDYTSVGSIFGQGDNPLFSDHKAMNVNDIVTVVISENAQSSNSGSKQLSENDETAFGNGTPFTQVGGNPAANAYAKRLSDIANVGFNMSSSSAYQGQGSATKDASFNTTVSARIVKILQNGNYFISGKREILIDEQKQIIQTGGVIRPYDIDQNNRISSAQMSEAKILYKSEGDVDRATKQSWGTKIIQALWPF